MHPVSGTTFLRRAAILGRSMVVLTKGGLAGPVREALSVAGRLGCLREVSTCGLGPPLSWDASTRRVSPSHAGNDPVWTRLGGLFGKDVVRSAHLHACRPAYSFSALPELDLADATKEGRVLIVFCNGDTMETTYGLWLHAHATERARAEGWSPPAFVHDVTIMGFIKTAQDTPLTAPRAWPGRNARLT